MDLKFLELVANWEGAWNGTGSVLNGDDTPKLTFNEKLTFELVRSTPKFAVLQMEQRTCIPKQDSKDDSLHNETGFIQIIAQGDDEDDHAVEAGFSLFSTEGMLGEIGQGTFDGEKLVIKSERRGRMSLLDDGSETTRIHREYHLTQTNGEDVLRYSHYENDQLILKGELTEKVEHNVV